VTDDRKELGRKVRKKIHELVPTCVAAVDHIEYIGAYFFPEDMSDAEKTVKANTSAWEGIKVYVRPAPPVRGTMAVQPIK
jgi:hypothetical protein